MTKRTDKREFKLDLSVQTDPPLLELLCDNTIPNAK